MRTLFTTFYLLLFSFNLLTAQTKYNDLTDVNLKGNIKLFGQCFLEGISKPVNDNKKICKTGIGNTYNEKGFLISSRSISYNTTVLEIEYHYNNTGNLTATDYYYPEKKSTKSFHVTKNNVTAKNEMTYLFYEQDSLKSKTIYVRDNKGNLILQQNYGTDSKLNLERRYEYDSNNYRIKQSYWLMNVSGYSKKSTLESIITYQNDHYGNPVSEIDSLTKKRSTHTYTYDKTGNWLVRTSYNDKGEIKQITEQYFEYY